MIRTLDRMVGSTFAGIFVLTILSLPVVWIIGDLSERFDDYLDRQTPLTMGEIALGYLFQYPHFAVLSAPLAGMVAAVFTVQSMTTHREIMAAKSGGISFHRLIAPVWLVGAAMTAGAFLLDTVVPSANRRAAEILGDREVRREWRGNFVHQTEDDQVLTVGQLYVSDQSMRDGVLMESRGSDGALRHVWSAEAEWSADTGWTFLEGYLRLVHSDGEEAAFAFERYRPLSFAVPPEALLEEPREDEEMSYRELGLHAAAVERSGGDPRGLLVKQKQKLSIPAATLIIVIFGAPLATTAKKGGAAFGIGASLGSTLLYMILMRFFGAVGVTGALSPFWAAWAPNAIFLATGLVLQARVRT